MAGFSRENLARFRKKHPEKFTSPAEAFSRIHKGSFIFAHTACAEPQYLMNSLTRYVESDAHALLGTDVIQVWTLGVAPFADEYYERNFRHNSFFISDASRAAVNSGHADYTPVFLSRVPELFNSGVISIDVALIQVSLPDRNGNMSLGISIDIALAAVKNARMVIAQVNGRMPAVSGETFINIREVDCIIPHDEPLLEYSPRVPDEISRRVGRYAAKLVKDGDTIQVGYGSMPNAVLAGLAGKNDLGVHTELLTDGIISLVKKGVINNSRKSYDKNLTVATFCMGTNRSYRFLDRNHSFRFMPVDYTNSLRRIMSHRNMTAINSALQIDLTGQATSESIGSLFYSGIGGQADFMRGSVLSKGGRSILALRSTSNDGRHSRIVPQLDPGAGVTLNRGDVHYVVTEYGIAYLHGKSIRERALSLVGIAHPDFRPWLVEEAKKTGYISAGVKYVPGSAGIYPEHLTRTAVSRDGVPLILRPVKITDEDILKDFFYSLSDESSYHRFFSGKQYISRKFLQNFVINDYARQMVLIATVLREGKETVLGMGQYRVDDMSHRADVAFAVRDDTQGRGIGRHLLHGITRIAKMEGITGFTADVLPDNGPMLKLFASMRFLTTKKLVDGLYELVMDFRERRG